MRAIRWAAATLALGLSGAAHAQAPAGEPRFAIERYVIEGNTLIPEAAAAAIVAPYTGAARRFADIQNALAALQGAYLERGYNAVRVLVPEQDIRAGTVRLRVIEARVRQVRIAGNRHFDDDSVRASLPALSEGAPPNTRAIGANVALANENPARQQRVVLEATPEIGQVDAVVRVVDDEPRRASVFFDNSGNAATGHSRAGIGFLNADTWGADHVLNLQLITSPTQYDDVLIVGAGYRVPLYGRNAQLDVFGGYSDVDSGTLAELFTVSGRGTVLGARYTQVLPRQAGLDHKLALGFDWKAFDNDVQLVGGSPTLVPDVTTLTLALGYSGRDQTPGRTLAFSFGYAANQPYGEGDASPEAIAAARAGAKARFEIWRLGLSGSFALPQDNVLRIAVDGQYARYPLVPGEQFGLGGQASVRGFPERTVAHDTGHRVSLEMYGPESGHLITPGWQARVFGFIDAGRGRDQAPARLAPSNLMSVGAGLRASRGKALSLRLDVGLVTKGTATRDSGSVRTHFGVAYIF